MLHSPRRYLLDDAERHDALQILITPQTSFAISLMLTHFRYTVAPSRVEEMMACKNETEIDGLRRAYLRDGASFVRFIFVSTASSFWLIATAMTGALPRVAGDQAQRGLRHHGV